MDRRDRIRCKFCGKDIHGGIARFKRHLAGASTKGKKNSTKCKKVPEAASKEMLEFMRAYASKHNVTGESDQDNAGAAHDDEEEDAAATQTVAKRKAETVLIESPTQKTSRTIAGMLRKSPEEVIELRHSKDPSQAALNVGCFKRTSGDKDRVDDHWADFSLLMPFPSMLLDQEPLRLHWSPPGQYGPGYIPPTIHSLRLPLLAKSKKKTHALRDKHELAWQEYGCTLMSDGWTDGRTKHLVNFLVNSPAGTFFIDSVNISSLVANKELLVDLLEKKINDIGRDYVVQICTDNGANYKAAVLWWGAYGGLAYELQYLAKHIVSLCASASGCERNWSAFQNPRYLVNRVTSGDYDCPRKVLSFLTDLHASFRMLNLRNDFLRKKFDGMKYDLRRVEEVFYDVKIRGLVPGESKQEVAQS
ncbi:hypothetical protein ACQ4PT_051984 [Festuca glaucescens]